MSQMVLYFLNSTSVLSFHIDEVLTLYIGIGHIADMCGERYQAVCVGPGSAVPWIHYRHVGEHYQPVFV